MAQGIFIALEGVAGTGKSAVGKLLMEKLQDDGYRVCLTKEPTQGPIGKKIYDILYGRQEMISPLELQRLYVQDRKAHIEEYLLPRIDEGYVVITEQYWLCTLAFGMFSCELSDLINLHHEEIGTDFLRPTLTLLFDAPPEVSMARMTRDVSISRHYWEDLEKLKNVRQNYHTIRTTLPATLRNTIHVIEAHKEKEAVLEQLHSLVRPHLMTLTAS